MRIPNLGASYEGEGRTRFAVHTTVASTCDVRIFAAEGSPLRTLPLEPHGEGEFSATVEAPAGTLYKMVLDGRELPDPYARFLPQGVHGPAEVIAAGHAWQHDAPPARPLAEHVIYEIHVGTFTPEGTYASAAARLREVAALGVTAVELMPVSAFPGTRGWGYDGVAHFAPFTPYGRPDDLRALVDEAHGLGLAVLLDVVYNHFGPAGNYLAAYAPAYFTSRVKTAWGDAPDMAYAPMRRLVLENARYWLDEFRFDGLRLDAVHAIVDETPRHVLRELADLAAARAPRRLLIAEDDRNDPKTVTALGFDGVWADDFHHQLRVTMTGERDGYYAAYTPGADGVAAAINRGWLYQGQIYPPSGKARGHNAMELPASAFVYCIQNHDQVGNRAVGDRLTSMVSIDAYCAASMLLLYLPMTPLLFMGQEWAASSPFLFFTDHAAELGELVSKGRREEFKKFRAFSDPEVRSTIPDPQDEATFRRSQLDWNERAQGDHARVLALYRALIELRRTDPVLQSPQRDRLEASAQGSVLSVRRWQGDEHRLLAVNLGPQPSPTWPSAHGNPGWTAVTSSARGGSVDLGGTLPGHTAVLFRGKRR